MGNLEEGANWRKAASLAPGMELLGHDGGSIEVLAQRALDELATVYNIHVAEHRTYHVGQLGIWVHNANCCDLANQTAVDPAKRGSVSPTKLERNQINLDLTPSQQSRALDIAKNGDPMGAKTEALVNDVITSHGGTVLDGAK